jgi:hypothetical protein
MGKEQHVKIKHNIIYIVEADRSQLDFLKSEATRLEHLYVNHILYNQYIEIKEDEAVSIEEFVGLRRRGWQ